jgi:fatty-acyl-CoA synthase
MLKLATRNLYRTLLDAAVLQKQDSDLVAIRYLSTEVEPQTITRCDFREAAVNYASALQSMDVGSGDLVIIAHTQNLESIFAFWGALLLGAIPSMFPTLTEKLDPEIYMRNLNELVTLSQVRAILTTDATSPVRFTGQKRC